MESASAAEQVEIYRFRPEDLAPEARLPGISAFMRVRNGADFIEATIRSHLPHLNEIVVVQNQCTDATPTILARLRAEFGPHRLRLYNYQPRVFAPGSEGHVREPADSPLSFVNMSNFALAKTRYRVAVKLDDDHIAMEDRLSGLVGGIRNDDYHLEHDLCFSGINLAYDDEGTLGVLAREPLVGGGDHFFFEVSPRTHFVHDPRFEDFRHDKPRRLADITYWHVKHLKDGLGFANRGIENGDNPRFARKRETFLADRRVIDMTELAHAAPWWLPLAPLLPLPEKARLKTARWSRVVHGEPRNEETIALCRALNLNLARSVWAEGSDTQPSFVAA